MKKVSQWVASMGIVIMPWLASAQNYIGSQTNNPALGSIKDIIESVGRFISKSVMPILVVLAILYFLWNLVSYISKLDNEKERESFKKYTINAILALFIMLSFWGIVAIGTNTLFGIQPLIPQLITNDNRNSRSVQ